MGTFEALVAEGAEAPIEGWDFSWLDGRATEARPSWRYFDLVGERAGEVASLLELQAGTGRMIGRLPTLPPRAVATDGYPPSLAVARPLLASRGFALVHTDERVEALPFADASFDLVVSRHPVTVWWTEIARVLRPGGTYLAQHVGPHSLRDLSERFVGPWPDASDRDPSVERPAAEAAGLRVERMVVERPRTAFFDIGAVVAFLRLVPWIVPGFTVDRFRSEVEVLHRQIERDGAYETTASRTLVEAVRPSGPTLVLRDFVPADQRLVRALVLAGLGEHFGRIDETANPDLDDIAGSYRHGRTVVGEVDGRVVATGTIVPFGERGAQVVRTSVAPAMRRTGTGRRVVADLLATARTWGVAEVVVETNAAWTEVVAFWRSCGFAASHLAPGDYGEEIWLVRPP